VPRDHHRLIRALLYLATAAILGATLFPASGTAYTRPAGCLICGDRGLADALLNILLFAPLGSAVALVGAPLWRATLVAAALSVGVEVAQLFVPGRDASLGDVLFNVVGASLGVFLVRSSVYWLRPRAAAARVLTSAAVLLAVGIHAAAGLLLQPSLPRSQRYFGMWTPRLGHLQPYRGRVADAGIGSMPIVSYDTLDIARFQSAFLSGDPVYVRVVAGQRATALAPIVAVFDDARREVLLLGAHEDAVVLRFRTRAAEARLDQPDIRALGAIRHVAAGDTVRLSVRRVPRRFCLDAGMGERCTLGYTLGRAWGLLIYLESWPDWLRWIVDLLWIAALAVPIGFWARTRVVLVPAALVLTIALITVPMLVDVLPTPLAQLISGLAGVMLGVLAHRTLPAPASGVRK
jgi:hypothetical protein